MQLVSLFTCILCIPVRRHIYAKPFPLARFLPLLATPLILAALCQGGAPQAAPASAEPALAAPDTSFDIGADADPDRIAELPIQTRSFEMGTAGFVPKHFPDSSEADWTDFFSAGAAAYGGIFGIHVNAGDKADQNHLLEQAVLGFEHVQGVETYLALSYSKEDGPFTAAMGERLVLVAEAAAQKYQPRYLSLGVESTRFSSSILRPLTFMSITLARPMMPSRRLARRPG